MQIMSSLQANALDFRNYIELCYQFTEESANQMFSAQTMHKICELNRTNGQRFYPFSPEALEHFINYPG